MLAKHRPIVLALALAHCGDPEGQTTDGPVSTSDTSSSTTQSPTTSAGDTTSTTALPTTDPDPTTDPTTTSVGPTTTGDPTTACTPNDCLAQALLCGPTDDGCGLPLDCGTCPEGQECITGGCVDIAGLPSPPRDTYPPPALQPDFGPSYDVVAGNGAGGVSMNMVWAMWEGAEKPAPCDPVSEQEYAGRCFTIPQAFDDSIREYSSRGVVVTGIVYGVPAWARVNHPCSPVAPGFEVFCAPDDPAAYGRFAGMLADRYDGMHGHGRIADFVIHNEVNANDWYDIGCGQGTPCDTNAWISRYVADWNAAYDAILGEQSTAKVFISLEHHFGTTFDNPGAKNPLLSGETFLTGFAAGVGDRAWRVAFHPYPPNLLKPEFSADDLPQVTYGTIGALAGWLYQRYPASVAAREIHLTESGVNSLAPNSNATAQANGVCDSLRNVLATPGIESYVYHRMQDNPAETVSGLGLGLRDVDGKAKPAWSVWALANRTDTNPPMLSCGFEDVPYIRLRRGVHPKRGHWVSGRLLPPGFTAETAGWRVWRDAQPGTILLFECAIGGHNFLTKDPGCEGQQPMGPVGWVYTDMQPGTVALRRCSIKAGKDHLATINPQCEGVTDEGVLGYVLP